MGALPPTDIAPERLFRLLVARAPQVGLAHRIPLAGADVPLYARAVPALDFDLVADSIETASSRRAALSAAMRELVARTLVTADGRPAFASGDEIGRLPGRFVEPIFSAWADAIDRVCPRFGHSDTKAWRRALTLGAGHASNLRLASRLAGCRDPITGLAKLVWISHPERFWDITPAELLDGHVLAYEAARAATDP